MKKARRTLAIVSTISIPHPATMFPMEAIVNPPSRGSRLDADHPRNGVLIPCRFTLRGGRPATVASHPVCRAAAKGMADELQGERQAEGPCRCAQQERKQVVGA